MIKLSKKSLIQFLKYNFGGLVYFCSAFLIITFGTEYLGLWWANILGNGVGIILNFLVQRFIAFNGDKKHLFNAGWKYGLITLINLVISYFILKFLTDGLGLKLWFSQFVSSGFFTIWNWIWYKYWVFRGKS